jgi:hypothetical protein
VDTRKLASERPKTSGLGAWWTWAIAIPAAGMITFVLIGTMAGLVDGRSILEKLVRLFPLEEQAVGDDDLPAMRPGRHEVSIAFEGRVGTRKQDRFVPLERVEILGIRASGDDRSIEVGAGGRFRFESAFPDERASAPATRQLVIRSPGCSERRVPVTRAWLRPRQIVLDCP